MCRDGPIGVKSSARAEGLRWKMDCHCLHTLRDMKMSRGKVVGLGFVFMWFLVGGIAHFAATNLEITIVPPYIPWPRIAVLVSGVFELLGAFGLLIPSTRRAAGAGLFLLTVAVTPAHVYMLERPELFSVPYWALVLRLPVQAGLLALIAWSTHAFAVKSVRRPDSRAAR